ncbi:hypothetical protein CARUB_v10025672mg [Capsella rubella]|uniref:Uncharacterized protein n=1 Tax=Capsella rubella TaxID=81985 RepID=R0HVD5_9BRAS|nr:hypothetical protein CARUB_v10025672mg [Capsella rubella]
MLGPSLFFNILKNPQIKTFSTSIDFPRVGTMNYTQLTLVVNQSRTVLNLSHPFRFVEKAKLLEPNIETNNHNIFWTAIELSDVIQNTVNANPAIENRTKRFRAFDHSPNHFFTSS